MRTIKQHVWEWIIAAVMVAVCLVMSVLQFRWTGAVADAERGQLLRRAEDQAPRLARAFDTVLTETCTQLKLMTAELTPDKRAAALHTRWQQWQSGNPRPVFKRLGVALPTAQGVTLELLDLASGEIKPEPWPAEWAALRRNLDANVTGGGSGPFSDASGWLLEFPLFGSARRGGGPPPRGPGGDGPGSEAGWMIFELDAAYAQKTWLPELVRDYLNPAGREIHSVRVTAGAQTIFTSGSMESTEQAGAVSLPFNHQGRAAAGGGRGGGARWNLTVSQTASGLEQVVAVSRWRNLLIALALNALVLAAGVWLLLLARRSRRLAEERLKFVATVSHELRTPLAVVRGAAFNLEQGIVSEPERVRHYAGMISGQMEQLSDLVEQTLDLAGAGRTQSADRLQRVTLPDILAEVLAATRSEVEAAGCRVELNLTDNLPPLMADPTALRRVFQNLISNAARHGGSGGWIGVEASAAGREVSITVKDKGPGIPLKEQKSLFRAFVRGARAEAEQIRGSGIGLSVVQELIAAHGGSVSVQSQPGSGAAFTVRLPLPNQNP